VLRDEVDGILVQPKSDAELATALTRLLADPSTRERMASNGRLRASEYRWDKVASNILTFYEEVLTRRQEQPVLSRRRFQRMRRAAADVANLLVR
jgi:glycosyltransferase involved in cell wall biosynthesis